MKNIFYLFIATLVLMSCSAGDDITQEFFFDKVNLELCEATTNNFIYFKINNQTLEGISLNFSQSNFTETTLDTVELTLNTTNVLIYRKFNKSIDSDYYCGLLPSRDITVTEEFVSSGGTATIATIITKENDTILDNDIITITENTYQTTINFTDLRLNSADEQFTYENLILEGTRTAVNDTIMK